ncbi:hypothetical protein [Amycolatopsis sp. 195334CR]|uniref:hypothetical protein n=1 Tax=Amycolatopsis sp. 195334CR TaxID=2814588 RepID=UPI001A8E8DEB|nr:hypothetical protein [Amycolatopsis sp. 195334CR]MBN6040002.1 hypothetical protein [Amycolatopsis sp. 195334CR]
MTRERSDEQAAFAVVERVLSARVEPYDLGDRPNVVDGLLHYPDGRTGVLEISSLGPQAEAAITAVLADRAKSRYTVAGLRNNWIVTVPRDFPPRDLKGIDALLLTCEEHDAGSLEQLYGAALLGHVSSAVAEAVDAGVSADVARSSTAQPPEVWIMADGIGGAAGGGERLLPGELATHLESPTMQSKLAKLGKDGHDDRHLFLWVRMSAFTFAVTDNLYFGGPLPSEPPDLPGGLSQLWLAAGSSSGGVVRAIHGDRWVREHPYANSPRSGAADN